MMTRRAKVPTQERFWAKVDQSAGPDGCWLWTAGMTAKGYGVFHIDEKAYLAHRIVYEWHTGIPLGKLHIDHRCHVKHCVNPRHLRTATPKQNQENRSGVQRNSKVGRRGVSRHRYGWNAVVSHNGKRWRKYYATIEEAAEAARLKRIELFTHNDIDRNTR